MQSLDEPTLRKKVENNIFEQGKNGLREGHVILLVQRGDSLYAKVADSAVEHSDVTINEDQNKEIEATCTCAYAEVWGGWCKHIVAVLLKLNGDEVEEQLPLAEVLKSLSAQQLLAILTEVSDRDPRFYEAVVEAFNAMSAQPRDQLEEEADESTLLHPTIDGKVEKSGAKKTY